MTPATLKIELTPAQMHHIISEASTWPWWAGIGDEEECDQVWQIKAESRTTGEIAWHQIDWEQGLALLLSGRHCFHTIDLRLFDVDNGGFTDSADKFLQLCVFGDIVYG